MLLSPRRGVNEEPRFVQIGYVCRKAAHCVRYQTPKGSASIPQTESTFVDKARCHGASIAQSARTLPLAAIFGIQEEMQWQTDPNPAVVAWAMARESVQSGNLLESPLGQKQRHQRSEFRDSQAGRPE